jgi:hypothetical protein
MKFLRFIQFYEKEWATLYRLTTSTSQVNFKSEQYQRDFATYLSHDHAKCHCLLASLMEKFPNEVDNISTKDASSFEEVKNKFLNLYSAGGNGDSAHHTFGNKKNKSRKREPNPLVPALPNPVPPPTLRMPPPSQRQRLAPGVLNTMLLKPMDMVGMNAPS